MPSGNAIVVLPTDMFYNTGISTCVWILSNRKPDDHRGLVQLTDASSFWQKMRKSVGSKRKEMSDEHIATVTRLFGDVVEASLVTVLDAGGKELGRQVLMDGEALPSAPAGGKVRKAPVSRIFRNEDFGYRGIAVERSLRDDSGKPVLGQKGKRPSKSAGKPQPDGSLRDTENVPLSQDAQAYFRHEVLPPRPTPGSTPT